jgi:hypothetical protein
MLSVPNLSKNVTTPLRNPEQARHGHHRRDADDDA